MRHKSKCKPLCVCARADTHTFTLPAGMLPEESSPPPMFLLPKLQEPSPTGLSPGSKTTGFHFFHVGEGPGLLRETLTQPPTAPPSPWITQDRDSPEERMEAGVRGGGAERCLSSPHLTPHLHSADVQ